MPQIQTFAEALGRAQPNRFVLLGNGFSIAWNYEAFSYGSLMEKADFSRLGCEARKLFDGLGTSDFEVVIERLQSADTIVRLYDASSSIAQQAARDAEILRDILAEALAQNHPETVASIGTEEYASARKFLGHFSSVYSLNYDLLLYWTTMQDAERFADVPRDDGFRSDPDEPDGEWVAWDMANARSQTVHYLHGALHLFDAGDRLKKLTWKRTGLALVDQIRSQLAEGSYPLVVTEGTSSAKKEKILHSGYLTKALRSFTQKGGDLFVYGHSLAENDRHILDAIARSRVERLWVSVYGSPASSANQDLFARAESLEERRLEYVAEREPGRRKGRTLEVGFYDAASAQVWGR